MSIIKVHTSGSFRSFGMPLIAFMGASLVGDLGDGKEAVDVEPALLSRGPSSWSSSRDCWMEILVR
jgi:hypothetical protein